MQHIRQSKIVLTGVTLFLFVTFVLIGCSGSPFGRNKAKGAAGLGESVGIGPRYYNFGDVLVPREFKVNDKKSYMVESAGMATGILTLKGRVEINSLVSFYKTNMPKDGWNFITSFKSPLKTMMLFQKDQRWCVINITGDIIYTHLEIGVAPSYEQTASGLLKSSE